MDLGQSRGVARAGGNDDGLGEAFHDCMRLRRMALRSRADASRWPL
jgi:hypothetical protein